MGNDAGGKITGARRRLFNSGALALPTLLLPMFLLAAAGCGSSSPEIKTATTTATVTVPAGYTRRRVDFFRGIVEPHADQWQAMIRDAGQLRQDGFNAVTLEPPVLITARAGGRPQVILEGQAAEAESLIGSFHDQGFAVYISPTTEAGGLTKTVDPSDTNIRHLQDDAVRWAQKAEKRQVELFSPLNQYNLVLGNSAAADRFSRAVLPLVRQSYHGSVAAEVVPDLGAWPSAGMPHDFEKLDYRGYDYLLLDIFPKGGKFDPAAFDAYVTDVLDRAAAVARRDGLKGVMVGQFGAARQGTFSAGNPSGDQAPETQTGTTGATSESAGGASGGAGGAPGGTALTDQQQAQMADDLLRIAVPRTSGIFFYGWTLPGAGAKGEPVESVLRKYFAAGRP